MHLQNWTRHNPLKGKAPNEADGRQLTDSITPETPYGIAVVVEICGNSWGWERERIAGALSWALGKAGVWMDTATGLVVWAEGNEPNVDVGTRGLLSFTIAANLSYPNEELVAWIHRLTGEKPGAAAVRMALSRSELWEKVGDNSWKRGYMADFQGTPA